MVSDTGLTISEDDYLAHYGILRKSGRYPYGSGGPEKSGDKEFLGYVAKMRTEGLNYTQIAKGLGITTTELRNATTIANNRERAARIAQAEKLKRTGMSNGAIAKEMGLPSESSVRALLAPGAKERVDILTSTANMLREQVEKKGFIDVGTQTESYIGRTGISKEKLKAAVALLESEGYVTHNVKVRTTIGNLNNMKVLCPPGTEWKDVINNTDKIRQITDYSEDGGYTFSKIQPPLSISSKRVAVRYAEDGGADADGVIYVRPGKDDLSLGGVRYAQVRIAVDGTHYLKGMAMYKDDLPAGVDLMFNTNKKKSETPTDLDAMKPLQRDAATGEVDQTNPFGSIVRQIGDPIPGGGKKLTSVMNLVNEEGDWQKWKKSIASQVLSKQKPELAERQLRETYEKRQASFDEIMSLTNPAVRKKLLMTFADETDTASVNLKAAALPRTASHVILPINSLKPTEIYAPNYNDGERVALIRYPHGGKFEIPELTVNNRHREARSLLGNAIDAVGINSKVAERLSGADFDGDTVLVIPNNKGEIKSEPALRRLKDFEPKEAYRGYEGMPKMTARQKGQKMGDVSNLITDMTIKGASTDELARAVRHSMVVIDAEKHNLDWRRSAQDHGIAALKKKYQGKANAGAATLISKAGARIDVPHRKPRPAKDGGPIDRETGKKMFTPTGEHYFRRVENKRTGEVTLKRVDVTMRSKKLAETDDAHTLSSGTKIEEIYASHSNRMKDLANQARRVAVNTDNVVRSPSAAKAYHNEVASLDSKLFKALRNAPLERQAQIIAGATIAAKKRDNPDMDETEEKKVRRLALEEARARMGAKKEQVVVADREWEAIQAGAISNKKLNDILNNADIERIKELATPKTNLKMTPTLTAKAEAMLRNGATQAEVASALGVSVSTIKNNVSV